MGCTMQWRMPPAGVRRWMWWRRYTGTWRRKRNCAGRSAMLPGDAAGSRSMAIGFMSRRSSWRRLSQKCRRIRDGRAVHGMAGDVLFRSKGYARRATVGRLDAASTLRSDGATMAGGSLRGDARQASDRPRPARRALFLCRMAGGAGGDLSRPPARIGSNHCPIAVVSRIASSTELRLKFTDH